MRSDRQLSLSVSIVIGIGVAIALAAIPLFGRMAPAIEDILEENVASSEAVESMLSALAELPHSPAAARRTFDEAFASARRNVTEQHEGPVLLRIEQLAPAAFGGDQDSAHQLVAEVRTLGGINRQAMVTADESAKRLGIAGAWTMVALGAVGFVVGLFTERRLRKRLLVPLGEIHDTLRAASAGDRLRRCTPPSATCSDLEEIMTWINHLLDRQLTQQISTLRESITEAPQEGSSPRTSLIPPSE